MDQVAGRGWKRPYQVLRRWARVLQGRDLLIPRQMRVDKVVLGNKYGPWCICPEGISPNAVVYSFGVGQDISFDLELIRRFGVRVHAFDPTPRSIAWLKSQDLPEGFVFHRYGIADYDGNAVFLPPEKSEYVSYTVIPKGHTGHSPVSAPVCRLATIMKMLGHEKIDLLKMDIEGAEYSVLKDLISSAIPVDQLLVEFHHRWPEVGVQETRAAVQDLNRAGYQVFDISPSGEEYSFRSTQPVASRSRVASTSLQAAP